MCLHIDSSLAASLQIVVSTTLFCLFSLPSIYLASILPSSLYHNFSDSSSSIHLHGQKR